MRYTTIVDISEAPRLYRSESVRLLYLHLCLRCGYHDDDRGLVRQSIRAMAADTGLSVSAVRHAMEVLVKWQLLRRVRGNLYVVNWVSERPITTPAKRQRQVNQQEQQAAAAAINRQNSEQLSKERHEFIKHFEESNEARKKFEANFKNKLKKI